LCMGSVHLISLIFGFLFSPFCPVQQFIKN
jgi:hypothetical protein